MGCNLLCGVHFFEGIFWYGENLCLHFRADIFVLDDWFEVFSVSHLCPVQIIIKFQFLVNNKIITIKELKIKFIRYDIKVHYLMN